MLARRVSILEGTQGTAADKKHLSSPVLLCSHAHGRQVLVFCLSIAIPIL